MFIRSFLRDEDDDKSGTAGMASTAGVGSGDGGDTGATGPSNADIKASPLFQKLTTQVAELTKANADRADAEVAAAAEVEEKRLKDAGLFDEATAAHKAALEAKDAAHAAELQTRDIEAALLKANFRNETFVKGAVASYSAETDGTIVEYVTALAADEANAAFIVAPGAPGDPPPRPPGKNTVDGAGNANWDEVKVWEKSDKREDRMKARKLLGEYHDKNGKYPYERT